MTHSLENYVLPKKKTWKLIAKFSVDSKIYLKYNNIINQFQHFLCK